MSGLVSKKPAAAKPCPRAAAKAVRAKTAAAKKATNPDDGDPATTPAKAKAAAAKKAAKAKKTNDGDETQGATKAEVCVHLILMFVVL